MKGFKDKSGKFRPTENKHGVRKSWWSRDQSAKTQGIKIRKVDLPISSAGLRNVSLHARVGRFLKGRTKKQAIKSVNDAFELELDIGIPEKIAKSERAEALQEVKNVFGNKTRLARDHSFFEEYKIKQAQKNPKNIGRRDHELLLEIEHAKMQLKMAKGQPLRQQYFKNKITKLESRLI